MMQYWDMTGSDSPVLLLVIGRTKLWNLYPMGRMLKCKVCYHHSWR
uniref:Uncharacterized protein n=1 Tax=Arundo donax TaxID=35708 RepID=A0A0A9BEL9_ARUDO